MKTKVLYIAGAGRSGSTLLGQVLGQVDGLFHVGELKYVWERGLVDNQLCGCGKPFRECQFWRSVFEYGNLKHSNASELAHLRNRVDRVRFLPQMLLSWKTKRYHKQFIEYTHYLTDLYASIACISDSRIIVDSSKDPSPAYLLSVMPTIDLYIVHLIRDSRAVAHSWTRKKLRPEIRGEKTYIGQFTPLQSAWGWLKVNALFAPVEHFGWNYFRIRYEDFVQAPEENLSRVLSFVQEVGNASFIDGQSIYVEPTHTVSGNPMRFSHGIMRIRLDDKWKKRLSNQDKRIIDMITWPLLWKYGYRLRK